MHFYRNNFEDARQAHWQSVYGRKMLVYALIVYTDPIQQWTK